jgi:hypothetical protein
LKEWYKLVSIIGLPAKAVRTTIDKLSGDPRVAILLLETDELMHDVILDRIGDSRQFEVYGTFFVPISRVRLGTGHG